MNWPNVFIIILNWNGLKDTLECLVSVSGLNYPNFEVVVVDNGSTDDPCELIAERFPQVITISNKENLGFSGGCNAGITYALNHKADYVWLLNNDTVVHADALLNLVAESEKDARIGIAGSKVYYHDSPRELWFAGSHIDWWHGFTGHDGMGKIDVGQFDTVKDVDRVTGCSMLVKSEVCSTTGILDEKFFLYVEEVDWCVRAAKTGFRCVFVPSSAVYHKVSASASKAGILSALFEYYNTRNFLYLVKKSLTFPARETILLKLILSKVRWEKRNLLRAVYSLINPGARLEPAMSPMLYAIRDFLLNRMGKADYKF